MASLVGIHHIEARGDWSASGTWWSGRESRRTRQPSQLAGDRMLVTGNIQVPQRELPAENLFSTAQTWLKCGHSSRWPSPNRQSVPTCPRTSHRLAASSTTRPARRGRVRTRRAASGVGVSSAGWTVSGPSGKPLPGAVYDRKWDRCYRNCPVDCAWLTCSRKESTNEARQGCVRWNLQRARDSDRFCPLGATSLCQECPVSGHISRLRSDAGLFGFGSWQLQVHQGGTASTGSPSWLFEVTRTQ